MFKKIILVFWVFVLVMSMFGCGNGDSAQITENGTVLTAKSTAAPTAKPTAAPAAKPTALPTAKPTAAPAAKPTALPTAKPAAASAAKPTAAPAAKPTAMPTAKPTAAPTAKPTATPTAKPNENTMNKEPKLIVNNKDITEGNYILFNYEKRYVELPLIAISEALGAIVTWRSSTEATISLKGVVYVLNTVENSLCKEGSEDNIILLPPGSSHGSYYKHVGNEFIIDSSSIDYFLYQNGAYLHITFDKALVNIIYGD